MEVGRSGEMLIRTYDRRDAHFKIATKCIAKQFEKVLPKVFNRDQTGLCQKSLYWRQHSR